MPTHPPAPAELLRARSLRVTRPRVAALRALEHHPHSGVEALRTAVIDDIGTVSVQAMYDVLASLTGADLVRRIEPAGSPALFELRVGDNHHHMVCRGCGRVEDVECETGSAPCLQPSDDHGFVVDEAEVTWWGYCADCADARAEQLPSKQSPVRAKGAS